MTLTLAKIPPTHQPPNIQKHSLPQPPLHLAQSQRDHVKQIIRERISDTLHTAKDLAAEACLCTIKTGLLDTQKFCQSVGKTFILVEEHITCDQHGLGGLTQDTAVLFRGPSEDASVAICVTARGSLLHRNDSPWRVYKNVGDVRPSSER